MNLFRKDSYNFKPLHIRLFSRVREALSSSSEVEVDQQGNLYGL